MITELMFANADADAASLAAVVNGAASDPDVVTRTGQVVKPVAKVLAEIETSAASIVASAGYEPPVVYAAGLAITRASQTVYQGGETYAAVPTALPFVTGAIFDPAQWKLLVSKVLLSRAELKGVALPTGGQLQFLVDGFKTGPFIFVAANVKAFCDADPLEGVYIKPAGQDGTTGAWRRDYEGALNVKWFGSLCDADPFGTAGTDDTATNQAAIDFAVKLGGATIFVPANSICAGTLVANGKHNIRITGPAGQGAGYGVPPAATLIYTGAGTRFIDYRSSYACTVENIGVRYTSALFTGSLIDYSHDGTLADAAYGLVYRCLVGGMSVPGGPGPYSATRLIDLLDAILCVVVDNHICWGEIGVAGKKESSPGYSNAHYIALNTFDNLVISALANAGESWAIVSNWFEGINGNAGGGFNTGMPRAYWDDFSVGAGAITGAMAWFGNWFGDAVNVTVAWIQNNHTSIWGFAFVGNTVSTYSSAIAGILFTQTVLGGHIAGNGFNSFIDLGGVDHYGLNITANIFGGSDPVNLTYNSADIWFASNKVSGVFSTTLIRISKLQEFTLGAPGGGGAPGLYNFWAPTATDARLLLAADAAQTAEIVFQKGGVGRFRLGVDATQAYELIYTNLGAFVAYGRTVNLTTADYSFAGNLLPQADNTKDLGASGHRWGTVWAATGTINTSDRQAKDQIRPLTGAEFDALLDAVAAVDLVAFKFKDAIEAKGEEARDHYGVIAQDLAEEMTKRGLDPFGGGVLGRDELFEEVEEKYQAKRQKVERRRVPATSIEMIDGRATQVEKKVEREFPLFENVPLYDSRGRPITVPVRPMSLHRPDRRIHGDERAQAMAPEPPKPEPVMHSVPVMETYTATRKIERRAKDKDGQPAWRWNVRYNEFLILRAASFERDVRRALAKAS